jgi:hypothetical protein
MGRDSGVDCLGMAEARRHVAVLWREIGSKCKDGARKIVIQAAAAAAAPEHRGPSVPVRIDETRHAYHVCGINFLCLEVLNIFADRRNAITINQNTTVWKSSQLYRPSS